MEQKFADGNMADVIRIGDRVRKQKSPWWDATRQVLNHLEDVGYEWSPRILAENEETVDLTYIAGESIPASLENTENLEVLRVVGRRSRELHDALEGFRLDPGTDTVPWPVPPPGDDIICHNDISPWNTVMLDGSFQAFIDWDLVSYGTREWELAWICWRWAPIYPMNERAEFTPQVKIERCQTLLTAYGLDALDLQCFTDLIDRRMESAIEVVERLGAQGVPGFDRLLAAGQHLGGHDERVWLQQHRDIFTVGLESL